MPVYFNSLKTIITSYWGCAVVCIDVTMVRQVHYTNCTAIVVSNEYVYNGTLMYALRHSNYVCEWPTSDSLWKGQSVSPVWKAFFRSRDTFSDLSHMMMYNIVTWIKVVHTCWLCWLHRFLPIIGMIISFHKWTEFAMDNTFINFITAGMTHVVERMN